MRNCVDMSTLMLPPAAAASMTTMTTMTNTTPIAVAQPKERDDNRILVDLGPFL